VFQNIYSNEKMETRRRNMRVEREKFNCDTLILKDSSSHPCFSFSPLEFPFIPIKKFGKCEPNF
jgi:hypothetical protein